MTNDNRVALLIDYENIHLSLIKNKKKIINPNEFDVFRKTAQDYGVVAVAKAFAVWNNFPEQRDYFEHANIITAPVLQNLRNAADIALVVDCLSTVFTNPDINTYVLFTGDGGFAPLIFTLLDTHNKKVYLYCVDETVNDKAYQRLKENKISVEATFNDKLVEPNHLMLSNELIDLIKEVHDGAKRNKHGNHVSRGPFFRRLIKQPNFIHLSEDGCTKLLNNSVTNKLIFDREITEAGKVFHLLTLNYEHPLVKTLNLT